MKVTLVNPVFTRYGGVKGHGGSAPPINIGYLASYLKMNDTDIDVSIIDAEVLGLSYSEIEERLIKASPDIVGITSTTPSFQQVAQIAVICKKISPDIKVVLGGVHPSAFPEETASLSEVDYVVFGEGEITFFELVQTIKNKASPSPIKGLVYKEGGRVIKNLPRPLIANLDSLPFPARELMPHELYHSAPTKRVSTFKGTSISSSRGCPFDCTFCCAKVIWSRGCRIRSAVNVVDEIESCIKELGIREFNFTDELFTINRQRTVDICNEIRNRKLDIAWVCMTRADQLDDDMLKRMRLAGCREISLGVESGSQKILNAMKKNIAIEVIRDSVQKIKRHRIKLHASFMLGNIGETEETIRETIDFAKELNPDIAAFFVASPYPGTEMYREALAKGYLRSDIQWIDFSPLSKNPPAIEQPNLSSEQVFKWHRMAIGEFYLRPSYLLKRLSKLNQKIELLNLIDGMKIFFDIRTKQRV